MADTSQLRKNTPLDFSDDDPFAELTKIMGFDPRETVKKSEPPKPEPQAANVAPKPTAPVRAPEPVRTSYAPAAPVPAAAAPVAPRPVEAQAPVKQPVVQAPLMDDDFGIDLEKEMLGDLSVESLATPVAAAPAPAPRYQPYVPPRVAAPVAAAPAAPVQRHEPAAAEPVYAPAAASQPLEDDLDLAFEASLEDELSIDDRDYAPEPEAAPVAYGAHEAAFEQNEDALAEVDMDFGADFEDELLADLDTAIAPEAEMAPEAVQSFDGKEPDLEDELNALLGNAIPRASIGTAHDTRGDTTSRWVTRINHATGYSAGHGTAAPERPAAPAAAYVVPAQRAYAPPAPKAYAPAPEPVYAQAPEPEAADDDDDLENLLNVMTAEVQAPEPVEAHAPLPEYDHTPLEIGQSATAPQRRAPVSYAPDVETIDVPEAAVSYADDLDIPDVAYDEPAAPRGAYGDYDSDYTRSYAAPVAHQEREAVPAETKLAGSEPVDFDADFDALYRQVRDAAGDVNYASGGRASDQAYADADRQPHKQTIDPFATNMFDEDIEEELDLPSHARDTVEPAPRRGLMIAAIVGGVALLGGIGAFTLSFGDTNATNVPVVVKADDQPVKVKPENPGGTTIPNQDNKVFETMAGDGAGQTAQEKLISGSEEPLDVATAETAIEEDTAGLELTPKGEDRIDPALGATDETVNQDVVAVAPRKVKTMVVKSDGTLVPREDPAPAVVTAEPVVEAPAVDNTPVATPTFKTPGANTAVAVEETGTVPVVPAVKPTPLAPVAAEEPAVEEVAVAAPTETAATAAGSWSMQIASQPSAESAQATYEDLAKRYGGVIGGRGVNIVKAEISGKGTYWRVRIPADTKNDAIRLCESYKAAGGNCFVSR